MKRQNKAPSIIFYDGIAHKVGEMPDKLVEDVMIERWSRRMLRQRATGSSWFTIKLRTWFELGMDDERLLNLMERRARNAFAVLTTWELDGKVRSTTDSEGK